MDLGPELEGWLDTLPVESLPGLRSRFLGAYRPLMRSRRHRPSYTAALRRLDSPTAALSPDALAARGRLRGLLGEPGADADLEQALALDPACAEALAYRAEFHLRGGALAGSATTWLARAVELRPRRGLYRAWLSAAHALGGEAAPALEAADAAVVLDGTSVAARLLRGSLLERAGDLEGAASDYDAAIGVDPRCSGLHGLRAAVRWRRGERPGAVEDAHRAALLDPQDFDGFAALLCLSQGREPEAAAAHVPELLVAADALLRADPKCAWAMSARAGLLRDTRHPLEERALRAALDAEPQRAWLWAFLGSLRPLEELEHLDRAIALAPDIGWMRAWKGEALRRLGRGGEALPYIEEAIALGPDYPLAYAWRSRLREAAGDLAGALADLDRCADALDRPAFLQRREALRERAQTLLDTSRPQS